MSTEVAHYVVTAHPPGGVLCVAKGNFIHASQASVAICKSRRLEVRTASETGDAPFPIVTSVPINGRIVKLLPMTLPTHSLDLLFCITVNFQYAVLSLEGGVVQTLASGHVRPSLLGKPADGAPLVCLHSKCLVLHLYDGFLTVLPIHAGYRVPGQGTKGDTTPTNKTMLPSLLGEPYHLRLEESNILDIEILQSLVVGSPQIAILHQTSQGLQHVVVHSLDVKARQLALLWKKQRLDGGSSTLIAVPPKKAAAAASTASTTTQQQPGGVVVLGQRQITHLAKTTQVVPLPTSLILSYCALPVSPEGHARYLLGDEFGNLHMLTVGADDGMALDTLGSVTTLSSALVYMDPGWVFMGSQLGDSQLLQIHQEQTEQGGYLSVLEDYTHLGPIVDLDWVVPTHSASVVTASGSSISGSLRLVRNGIGMKEFAAVDLPGIQNMWAVRKEYAAAHDAYLVQAYVTETRILGVATVDDAMQEEDEEEEEEGATLEEVVLEGLDSTSSSLYVGNVQKGDLILQITEMELRLVDTTTYACVHTWVPDDGVIVVAAANEAGQIVVALRGGRLVYLQVVDGKTVEVVGKTQMASEVGCLNLNPFASATSMETDGRADAELSSIATVGLWDDFTVRVLSLDDELKEVLQIHLSTEDDDDSGELEGVSSPVRRNRNNMMARSLCLVTLDSSSSNAEGGVDMLFVGLGDGTLISFAVVQQDGAVSVQSKKEVSLGSQRINLIPLQTERGGTCVLATGDRPTVIYLAGGGSRNLTPKLCYSNVNLSTSEGDDDGGATPFAESIAVNVATPFFSPQLFDDSSLSSKHYSLCVSDDSILRLGVIDDIQKLHVTTCRLGMAPRRVVHCPEGRMFAVGCIESGIKELGTSTNDVSMGNLVRFLDDATFDDIERIDLEPHEMVLSMANVQLATSYATPQEPTADGESPASPPTKPYLIVGTAYALPDEDEPTNGRILLLSCEDENDGSTTRSVKHVAELQVRGGVYSICQFYNGLVLLTVNSKTQVCQLTHDGGALKLSFLGVGHHGHILSLMVQSRAPKQLTEAVDSDDKQMEDAAASTPVKKKAAKPEAKEQLAIVADLMRSISLVQYYPEHKALEEVARDFNSNWTTAIEMLNDNLYLGAENWNNLYVLRRNAKATSEEVRCRLDTVGQFHLGELCNKFISGSLTMPHTQSSSSSSNTTGASSRRKNTGTTTPVKGGGASKESKMRIRRAVVTIGSQTLFATVDGTLGSILGLDARTAAFFTTLERCMAKTIVPVGDFSHQEFRTFDAESRVHPARGFVDGDLIESFLDLDRPTMEAVVAAMNRDGGWEIENHSRKNKDDDDDDADVSESVLCVEDILAMVEEMTMFH